MWAMNPWWLNKQVFDEFTLFSADSPRADPLSLGSRRARAADVSGRSLGRSR